MKTLIIIISIFIIGCSKEKQLNDDLEGTWNTLVGPVNVIPTPSGFMVGQTKQLSFSFHPTINKRGNFEADHIDLTGQKQGDFYLKSKYKVVANKIILFNNYTNLDTFIVKNIAAHSLSLEIAGQLVNFHK